MGVSLALQESKELIMTITIRNIVILRNHYSSLRSYNNQKNNNIVLYIIKTRYILSKTPLKAHHIYLSSVSAARGVFGVGVWWAGVVPEGSGQCPRCCHQSCPASARASGLLSGPWTVRPSLCRTGTSHSWTSCSQKLRGRKLRI